MTYQPKTYRFLPLIFALLLAGPGAFAQDDPAPETPATEAGADVEIPETAPAPPGDGTVAPGEGNPDTGKGLWNANGCGSCHDRGMLKDAIGPALGGVEARWSGEPREHLYRWIQQSQALIASGESARATELWAAWAPNKMQNFTNLSDGDVEHLLAYIQGIADGTYGVVGGGIANGVAVVAEETDNTWLFVVLGLALLLLSLILARITSNLQYMVADASGAKPTRRTLMDILTSRGMIAFVIFAFVVFGGYTTVNHAIDLGRQQDYEPDQPIKFSHEVHAGIHKIECQYCHDGARRSKHSVIPAVNTCMNCHQAIQVGSQYGTAELTKIFAAIGWDPVAQAYIEDYESLSNEEVREVYAKWIAQEYLNTEEPDLDEIENVVEEQWEGIYTALTNEYTGDDKVAGPIEWVRIHNLPDHAYFNHAQHVTVGNLQCQNCHGPVQEMEVVYQYSPLSMGWCINCHRETQVQFKDNDYYQSYQKYHDEIREGTRTGVTVEDIGGLNCQRCHY